MNLQMLPSPEAKVTIELSSDYVGFLHPDGKYKENLVFDLEGPLYSENSDLMYNRITTAFTNVIFRPLLKLDNFDKRELRNEVLAHLDSSSIRFSNDYRANLGRSFEFEQLFDKISIKVKVEIQQPQADNKMTQVKQVEVINIETPVWANIQVIMKGKMIDFIMAKGIWQTEVDTKLSVRPLDREDYTALDQLEAYLEGIEIGPINNDAIPENEAAVEPAILNLKDFVAKFAETYSNKMAAGYYGEFGLKESFPEFDIEFKVIPDGEELVIPEPPKVSVITSIRIVRPKDIYVCKEGMDYRELVMTTPIKRINGLVDIENLCDSLYAELSGITFSMDGDDVETNKWMDAIVNQYEQTYPSLVNFVHDALNRENFLIPLGNFSYGVGGLAINARIVK